MFILPVNRDDEDTPFPWLLLLILLADAAILWLEMHAPSIEVVFRTWGFVPAEHRLVTVFSSMFLHADLWHLLGNAWFFWMFGRRIEAHFGKVFFALAFLLCGIGGAALHWTVNPQSPVPCVGASGAISGIAGSYFVLFPRARFDLCIYILRWEVKTIETHTYAAVGAWVGEQFVLGLISQFWHTMGVAFWAHVGGFATGLAVAFLFSRLPRIRGDSEMRAHLMTLRDPVE